MKIDAQYKIAELERRIVALEKAVKIQADTVRHVSRPFEPKLRKHWDRMWAEFDALMKTVFSR